MIKWFVKVGGTLRADPRDQAKAEGERTPELDGPVGAGAVVPRPLPPNVTAVGNPARVIKSHDSQVRVAVENRG